MNKMKLLLGRRILASASSSNTFGYSLNVIQNSIQIFKEKRTKYTNANDVDVVGIVDVNLSPINTNASVDVKKKKEHYYKMRPSSLWVSLDFE
jgi:hypothetical protein